MHFDLKSISTDAVPKALEKAERYRLLNEPYLAESICLDILTILPSHQQALVSLLLARTDQFDHGATMKSAEELLSRIEGEYERAYYAGLIWERQAHAQFCAGTPVPECSWGIRKFVLSPMRNFNPSPVSRNERFAKVFRHVIDEVASPKSRHRMPHNAFNAKEAA